MTDHTITLQPSLPQLLALRDLLSNQGLSSTEAHAELCAAVETGQTRWGKLSGMRHERHGALIKQLRGLK